MSLCSADLLLDDAEEFSTMGEPILRVLTVSLLIKILKSLDPMANCSTSALMANASEFAQFPEQLLSVLTVQLLCEINANGLGGPGTLPGGSTGGGVDKGEGPPVGAPDGTAGIYCDILPDAQTVLYWWNGTTWIPYG